MRSPGLLQRIVLRSSFLAQLDDLTDVAGSWVDDTIRIGHHDISSPLGAEIGIRVDQNMIDVAVDETSLHGCIENLERDGRLAAAAGELVLVGDRNVSGGHGGAEQRRDLAVAVEEAEAVAEGLERLVLSQALAVRAIPIACVLIL